MKSRETSCNVVSLEKNKFHGVDIGPLSKTLAVKSLSLMVPKSIVSISGDIRLTSFIDGL